MSRFINLCNNTNGQDELISDTIIINNKKILSPNKYSRIIKKLELKIENILNIGEKNVITPIKYKFYWENDSGHIEYKRNLDSYNKKKEKLLRQIYWRISQSLEHTYHNNYINKNINNNYINNNDYNYDKYPHCYYIIGLEDNGKSSFQTIKELEESLIVIKETISKTEIKYKNLYLYNELNKSNLLVVKLWIENDDLDLYNYFD